MPTAPPVEALKFSESCVELNRRVRDSNQFYAVVAGSLEALDEVCQRGAYLLPKIDTDPSRIGSLDLRASLVNIRVSSDDYALWLQTATEAEFKRVSSWARDAILGRLGYVATRPATRSVLQLRRELTGAINNAAQLQAIAEDVYPGATSLIDERGQFLTGLIARWNVLGRPA